MIGVGTGETHISGVSRYLKEQNPAMLVVGADPEGSIYTADDSSEVHEYAVEGVGEDFYPETVDLDLIDRWIGVSERRLVRE